MTPLDSLSLASILPPLRGEYLLPLMEGVTSLATKERTAVFALARSAL